MAGALPSRAENTACPGCGAAVTWRCEACGAAARAGHYELVRVLVQNARGRVYLGRRSGAEPLLILKETAFATVPTLKALE